MAESAQDRPVDNATGTSPAPVTGTGNSTDGDRRVYLIVAAVIVILTILQLIILF
jgi:hypothetical protein